MEFKSFQGNETDSMFQTMKGDDMNITMQEANITTEGFVSQEVKDQQVYHHYNNTNFFLTFREKHISKSSVKALANQMNDLLQGSVTSVKVKKIFQTFAVLELGV